MKTPDLSPAQRAAVIQADLVHLYSFRGARVRFAEALGLSRQAVFYWEKKGVPQAWHTNAIFLRVLRNLLAAANDGQSMSRYRTGVR